MTSHIAITNYCNPEDVAPIVKSMGATPILIDHTTLSTKDMDQFLSKIDGLILIGGEDINPALYEQKSNKLSGKPNNIRDRFEISLVKKAAFNKIKILGICRGNQLINVAFGGTLIQDIHTQGFPNHRYNHTVEIDVTNGPFAADLFGRGTLYVNSYHHQAIDNIAPDFRAYGYSNDGVIEIIYSDVFNILGVQWHPEWMLGTREVFKWLIN